MAYVQAWLPGDSTNAANFCAFAKAMHNAIISFGWVQTSDTGQVDWTTYNSLPSSGQGVYCIYHATDSLQGTAPIVFKLEWFNGGSAAYPIQIFVTVGVASNGTGGVLGGSSRLQLNQNGNNSATGTNGQLFDCVFSGGTSWLSALCWRDGGSNGVVLFTIERSKDNTGADNSSFIYFGYGGYSSTSGCGYLIIPTTPVGYLLTAAGAASPFFLPAPNPSSYANYTPCSPIYPFIGKPDNPLLSVVGGRAADFTEGVRAQVSIYGTNHIYYMTKATNPASMAGTGGCVGIRYE